MSENSAMFKYDEYGNTRETYVYSSGLSCMLTLLSIGEPPLPRMNGSASD
ncbi:hypothetical protein H206_00713 [Candidatus Electrothrix aarhusensis]|uniref:Uncharacterized protein n=1 Tax=Candidatus Electrothrix aarhusensis TaxID=1859131 RepID=A0A3S3RR43_9BACT|nr:hypothetical protein H206_00713 [Candidatus Electrothrix aarhusensis]